MLDQATINQSTLALINTLRPRQDGRHFADDIFTCIFFNENCCILIRFSLKYVRKGPIDNNPALVQIMAWRRPGDKPLSEPMMVRLQTHICVTRPQCAKTMPLQLPGINHFKHAQHDYSSRPVLHTNNKHGRISPNQTSLFTFNILRPRQNGRHFPHNIFQCIFLNGKSSNLK